MINCSLNIASSAIFVSVIVALIFEICYPFLRDKRCPLTSTEDSLQLDCPAASLCDCENTGLLLPDSYAKSDYYVQTSAPVSANNFTMALGSKRVTPEQMRRGINMLVIDGRRPVEVKMQGKHGAVYTIKRVPGICPFIENKEKNTWSCKQHVTCQRCVSGVVSLRSPSSIIKVRSMTPAQGGRVNFLRNLRLVQVGEAGQICEVGPEVTEYICVFKSEMDSVQMTVEEDVEILIEPIQRCPVTDDNLEGTRKTLHCLVNCLCQAKQDLTAFAAETTIVQLTSDWDAQVSNELLRFRIPVVGIIIPRPDDCDQKQELTVIQPIPWGAGFVQFNPDRAILDGPYKLAIIEKEVCFANRYEARQMEVICSYCCVCKVHSSDMTSLISDHLEDDNSVLKITSNWPGFYSLGSLKKDDKLASLLGLVYGSHETRALISADFGVTLELAGYPLLHHDVIYTFNIALKEGCPIKNLLIGQSYELGCHESCRCKIERELHAEAMDREDLRIAILFEQLPNLSSQKQDVDILERWDQAWETVQDVKFQFIGSELTDFARYEFNLMSMVPGVPMRSFDGLAYRCALYCRPNVEGFRSSLLKFSGNLLLKFILKPLCPIARRSGEMVAFDMVCKSICTCTTNLKNIPEAVLSKHSMIVTGYSRMWSLMFYGKESQIQRVVPCQPDRLRLSDLDRGTVCQIPAEAFKFAITAVDGASFEKELVSIEFRPISTALNLRPLAGGSSGVAHNLAKYISDMMTTTTTTTTTTTKSPLTKSAKISGGIGISLDKFFNKL